MKKLLSFASAVLMAAVWAAPTGIKCEMSPAGVVHPQGTTLTFKGKITRGDDLPADAGAVLDEFVSGMRRRSIPVKFDEDIVLSRKMVTPGCYSVQLRVVNSKRRTVKNLVSGIGVMVAPEKIQPSTARPADFETFWQSQLQELAKVPVKELSRTELPVTGKWATSVKCYDVKVSSAVGEPMTGILTMPVNAKPESLPAIVFFHGAGVRSALQMHSYGRMAIALDMNTHGLENNREAAYYQNLYRGKLSNYWYQNKDNRDKYYFRDVFLRALRAVEYVKSLPEWNGKVLIVRGSSQGGAMAVVAAALDPQVTMLFAAVPALADHGGFTARIPRVPGWPGLYLPKRDNAAVLECAGYYDIVNFAPMVKCPVYMSAGMADHTCEAAGIAAVWNALPENSKMQIEYYPAGNHRTSQLSAGVIRKLFEHFKK